MPPLQLALALCSTSQGLQRDTRGAVLLTLLAFCCWCQGTVAAVLAVWSVAWVVPLLTLLRGPLVSLQLPGIMSPRGLTLLPGPPACLMISSPSGAHLSQPPRASWDLSPSQTPTELLTSPLYLWATHTFPSTCEKSEMVQDLCCSPHRIFPCWIWY